MNVILVYMGSEDKFVLTAQVRALVNGMAVEPGKFNIRSFGGAAIGGYQQPHLFLQSY